MKPLFIQKSLFTFAALAAAFVLLSMNCCQAQEVVQIPPGLGSDIVDGIYSRIQLTEGGELRVIKRIKQSGVPQALAFSPDDRVLAVENRYGVQFHALSGTLMGSVSVPAVAQSPFYSSAPTISFASDTSRFMLVRDGVLNIWSLKSTPQALTPTHTWAWENVSAAAFSPDGTQVLLCEKKDTSFFLTLVSSEKKTVVWSRELGFTPALQIVVLPNANTITNDGAEADTGANDKTSYARVLSCSVPNRFYQTETLYDRAWKEPVAASVSTWNLESGESNSRFSLTDYYPAPAVLSPRGTFVY